MTPDRTCAEKASIRPDPLPGVNGAVEVWPGSLHLAAGELVRAAFPPDREVNHLQCPLELLESFRTETSHFECLGSQTKHIRAGTLRHCTFSMLYRSVSLAQACEIQRVLYARIC